MGVLAVLVSVVFAVVNPLEQFKKSADSKRKSDLAQIQRAIEAYYADHGEYPSMTTDEDNKNKICKDENCQQVVDWGSDWRPYMDVLPIDSNSSKTYAYWTDSSHQSYILLASLDRGSRDPQVCNGDSPCASSTTYAISCGSVCNYGVSSPNISP